MDGTFQLRRDVESVGKSDAIRCLLAAVESFLAGRNMSRAAFAETLLGMSESNFSKVVNGKQGDFFELVFKMPGDIRRDFWERIGEIERANPTQRAAEQLAQACLRFLQVVNLDSVEPRKRMAKVEPAVKAKARTA